MTKQLKAILAKDASTLTEVEKALLVKCANELDEKQKAKFSLILKDAEGDEGEGEGDEGGEEGDDEDLDEEALKALINDTVDASMKEKLDKYSAVMAKKLFSGVFEARKKALEAGEVKTEKQVSADEKTREFMKALLSKDSTRLKAVTTDGPHAAPDDAQAGYLIPQELSTEIYRIAQTQYGLARRLMRYMPFSGPGNERVIPVLSTGVSVFINGEKAKKQSTQPKFTRVIQSLKELAAIVPFTEQILEDSSINLTQLVATLFAEVLAKTEDEQFLAGDGSGGGWTGVLNNGSVNIVNQNVTGVANLTADDLLNMQDAIPTPAMPGAGYILNRRTLSIIRKLKGTDGQYIYQAPANGLPGTIWNAPYELSDAMPAPSVVADGDPYIIFGNLKMACVLGDKGGQMRMKLLTEATITDTDGTSINLAEQDMVALRVNERVGYNLVLPEAIAVLVSDAGSGS